MLEFTLNKLYMCKKISSVAAFLIFFIIEIPINNNVLKKKKIPLVFYSKSDTKADPIFFAQLKD